MSNDIVIFGAGGLGREMALMIEQINVAESQRWNLKGFYDDGKVKGEKIDNYECLGKLEDLVSVVFTLHVVIAIADPIIRKKVASTLKVNPALSFPCLIHPSALTGSEKFNTFSKGCIITAGNIITTNIALGEFAIVNLACTIGHDVSIGDYCSIMPGCHISGFIEIGEGAVLGTGCVILPHVKIGAAGVVGAGAVVTKDVPPHVTVIGIPAKVKE